jgi:hypothetical protein
MAWVVSDAADKDEYNNRPYLAEFPISDAHDSKMQEQRADMYAVYMNKIADATEIAYKQTALCDILKD